MNIFQVSIRAFVFAAAVLLGTTAVAASRFVITVVAGLASPSAAPESQIPAAVEPGKVAEFADLRNEPTAPEDFNPSGSYSLVTEDTPAAFADIEFLEIATHEYARENGTYTSRPIVPKGLLQAKKSFAFARIYVGNHEISFETAAKDGIAYQFVGHFPHTNEMIDCEECESLGDFSGRLKKLKNGKVIADLNVKFYLEGC